MVVLMFKNLDIPDGFTHKSSDWQIATDKYFKDIVVESRDDEVNLTSILFDVDLDPDKEYYARARVIMDYGPSDWSDIDIVRTEDLNNLDLDSDIPTVVGIPEVNINFPVNKVPPTLFTITTSPISISSNAKHLSSDFIISDTSGNMLWSSFDDQSNLTSNLINNIILPGDRFYIAKVAHKASSGDVSEFGKKLFYVPDAKEINVTSRLVDVENVHTDGLDVILEPVDDVENIYAKLYMIGANDPVQVFETVEDVFTFHIPKEVFQNPAGLYLLELQYEYINGEKTNTKYLRVSAV